MKVLVIGLSNLGDAILTYPALSALWAAYPAAEFHILASPRTRELFTGEAHFRHVWVWEKKAPMGSQLACILRLSGRGYGLVVDFRNSLIPLFMPWARRTPILRKRALVEEHRAVTHLRLVTSLGIPSAKEIVSLPFGSEEQLKVNVWVQTGRPIVLMVPGARSHLKRWRADRFAETAERLILKQGAQVILLGEESERPISEEVKRKMTQPLTDLTGRTTVRELAALLARANLMITNDSASLHAAEAMGVPTVAIFGPTDEKKYGPRHPRSAVVRRKLICAPCELALCPYGHECMQWVTSEEVYSAAAKILEPQT
ncbi:MAG: glycosyltransferase family 9 protein [Candidatus Omnitrophica bacterium]|nr:glycosyltransferase family 9 protein [Candidatus Omnitrophota bacterium]